MMRPRASLVLVGLGLVSGAEGLAYADSVPRAVTLEMRDCEAELESEVRRIANVELRSMVSPAETLDHDATRVLVICRGTEVHLELADPATSKHLERSVSLSIAMPISRPRLLALAIAELVVAVSEVSGPSDQPNAAAPPAPRPTPKDDGDSSSSSSSSRAGAPAVDGSEPEGLKPRRGKFHPGATVDAVGIVRVLPWASGLITWGGGVRSSIRLAGRLAMSLDIGAEAGSVSRSMGRVAVTAIEGAAGLGYGIEAAGLLLAPWVGIRGGTVSLRGEASADVAGAVGSAQSGPWFGPEIGMAALAFPRAPVHAMLGVSAGVVLLGVRGQVADEHGVDLLGPWAGLVGGVGFAKP